MSVSSFVFVGILNYLVFHMSSGIMPSEDFGKPHTTHTNNGKFSPVSTSNLVLLDKYHGIGWKYSVGLFVELCFRRIGVPLGPRTVSENTPVSIKNIYYRYSFFGEYRKIIYIDF